MFVEEEAVVVVIPVLDVGPAQLLVPTTAAEAIRRRFRGVSGVLDWRRGACTSDSELMVGAVGLLCLQHAQFPVLEAGAVCGRVPRPW
jgi:hypothetical protein